MLTVRSFVLPVVVGGLALLAAACASATAAPAWTFAPSSAPTTTSADEKVAPSSAPTTPSAPLAGTQPASATVTRLELTVVTGDMIGHTEFPAFIPSDFTLPANATVVVTVTNFDDATALPKGSEKYAQVTGTDGGTMTVTLIKAAYPNGDGAARTLTGLDPAAVSHTFTIPALGINVPIAPHARVTFTIHTGAPGTYAWRCFDPCGAGPTGWGTAMAAMRGFMEGTLTVV
jgi:hypothetical protein